ncbi:MAG: hypothetical protein HC772_09555 [Leptolyngbyaceae cyanobacterium CRU_2_3]|nr:hypothetical protein [Leptolyngbyaceae cyanobacterium CRU_2_3]
MESPLSNAISHNTTSTLYSSQVGTLTLEVGGLRNLLGVINVGLFQ